MHLKSGIGALKRAVKKVLEVVDHIFSIIKKEDVFYRELGGNVSYVGHPLIDMVLPKVSKETFKNQLGFLDSDKILAVFPGSRSQEINHCFPVFVQTLIKLKEEQPSIKPVVSVVSSFYKDKILEILRKYQILDHVSLYEGNSHDLIYTADFSMVTSGTISLEHAILHKPCLVIYKFNSISYVLLNLFLRLKLIEYHL